LNGRAPLQSEIVSDAKNPATKASTALAQLEVPKKCQEHLLSDFLSVMHGYTEREYIAENPISEFVEEAEDFKFDSHLARRKGGCGSLRQG
jgi:hypothetical protein